MQAHRSYFSVQISPDGLAVARRQLATRREPLARVLLDDIDRGCPGGTYYLDGRPVNPSAGDFYAVGGATDGVEIVLTEDDLACQDNAHAAVQLLREEVLALHAESDAPVGLGYWINGSLCYLDVSNIVSGRQPALQLARLRGQVAIYSFTLERALHL